MLPFLELGGGLMAGTDLGLLAGCHLAQPLLVDGLAVGGAGLRHLGADLLGHALAQRTPVRDQVGTGGAVLAGVHPDALDAPHVAAPCSCR